MADQDASLAGDPLDFTLPELAQMEVVRLMAEAVAQFMARRFGDDSGVLLLRTAAALMDETIDAHSTDQDRGVIKALMKPVRDACGGMLP